jgi:hypothetical protein
MIIENLTQAPIWIAAPVSVKTGEIRVKNRVENGQLVYFEEEVEVMRGASFDDGDGDPMAFELPPSTKLNDPKSIKIPKAAAAALDKAGILKPLEAGKMIRVTR